MNNKENHFTELTKDEQEEVNHKDLREMKHYYGSWDELRKVIELLEESDDEAAWERHCNDY